MLGKGLRRMDRTKRSL